LATSIPAPSRLRNIRVLLLVGLVISGSACGRDDAARDAASTPAATDDPASKRDADQTSDLAASSASDSAEAAPLTPINPPPDDEEAPLPTRPEDVVREAQVAALARERDRLLQLVTAPSQEMARTLSRDQLRPYLGAAAPQGETDLQGARAVVRLDRRRQDPVVVLLQEDGRWRIDFRATAGWHEADPGPKDTGNRPVKLDDALDGISGAAGDGALHAILETTEGTLRCRLFPARAPRTVANFVALARGLRGFVDPKSGAWTKRPLYDGLAFHRVIAGGLAQTGDPTGTGRGGPGYELPDELDPTLRFDRAGILAMANRGPNTNGSQVFVTARPLPELNGRNTAFGVCDPVAVVERLTRAPVAEGTDRPTEPPLLTRVTFERGGGPR